MFETIKVLQFSINKIFFQIFSKKNSYRRFKLTKKSIDFMMENFMSTNINYILLHKQ